MQAISRRAKESRSSSSIHDSKFQFYHPGSAYDHVLLLGPALAHRYRDLDAAVLSALTRRLLDDEICRIALKLTVYPQALTTELSRWLDDFLSLLAIALSPWCHGVLSSRRALDLKAQPVMGFAERPCSLSKALRPSLSSQHGDGIADSRRSLFLAPFWPRLYPRTAARRLQTWTSNTIITLLHTHRISVYLH